MKPDWKDAPYWAHYLAQDANSDWFFFEEEPQWDRFELEWLPQRGTQVAWAGSGYTTGYIEVRQ